MSRKIIYEESLSRLKIIYDFTDYFRQRYRSDVIIMAAHIFSIDPILTNFPLSPSLFLPHSPSLHLSPSFPLSFSLSLLANLMSGKEPYLRSFPRGWERALCNIKQLQQREMGRSSNYSTWEQS